MRKKSTQSFLFFPIFFFFIFSTAFSYRVSSLSTSPAFNLHVHTCISWLRINLAAIFCMVGAQDSVHRELVQQTYGVDTVFGIKFLVGIFVYHLALLRSSSNRLIQLMPFPRSARRKLTPTNTTCVYVL